jgi:hypothetical protein
MQRKDRQNQSIKFALEIYNQQGAYLSQTQSMTHTGECATHITPKPVQQWQTLRLLIEDNLQRSSPTRAPVSLTP